MKAGFNGLRGKEISLISIVLMSATIILWSWEKMPGLSAFLPPQTPPLLALMDYGRKSVGVENRTEVEE